MFIKIKLEPQSLKALSPLKKMSYFSIDDDATIINLKMKIEEYVDVPAERQEIRTLTKVFQNCWLVKEVCDVRGSAIMLYSYDEYYEYEEPQFVCFLQVYTNELAVQQQELEELLKVSIAKGKIVTPSSSTSSVTLIADSESEGDSDGTATETVSSKSSDSDTEAGDNTDSSVDSECGKKRSKHDKKNIIQNKKLKVAGNTSGNQYSETLCQYLDEFPKCSKELNFTENKEAPKKSLKQTFIETHNEENISNICTVSSKPSANANKDSPEENKKQIQENPKTIAMPETIPSISNTSNKIQSNIITTTNSKTNNSNIHPCYMINPEIRDYLAIISSNDINSNITTVECEELLIWFFDRFRACDSSNSLQFDNKTAITLYEGKVWIACMNVYTFQWISLNIAKYTTKSYQILALNESKHLCEVVVPVVANSKNILDIFELLEKQNKNVSTIKWSLQSRRDLKEGDKDFNEKSISNFCTNELFIIAVDKESRENLEKLNFKLNYCFWQIVFKFN